MLGDDLGIEQFTADLAQSGTLGTHRDVDNLLRRVAVSIGHGDPNCANFVYWAAFDVDGNVQNFADALPLLSNSVHQLISRKTEPHPELHQIEMIHEHFTAQRIPQITLLERSFHIRWPGSQEDCYSGNPPAKIQL